MHILRHVWVADRELQGAARPKSTITDETKSKLRGRCLEVRVKRSTKTGRVSHARAASSAQWPATDSAEVLPLRLAKDVK